VTALDPGRRAQARDPEDQPGRLVLDASRSALSPHLAGRRITVTVDELPLRFAWGRTSIDLPAGRHLVEIEVDHGHGWGRVVDAVPVAAGGTVEVFYRAPALPGQPGALGPEPQPTPGLAALLGWSAVSVLVVLAAVGVLLGVVALLV